MLIILNDPNGITGRTEFEWVYSKTIQQNIETHLESGGECEVLFNGVKIDPCADVRLDGLPNAFDRVTIVRRPAATALPYVIGALAAVLVTSATIPKTPSPSVSPITGSEASAKESPNNSLTTQTNIARAYQAIPDVYGYRRVWPDLIQPSYVYYVNQVKYVTEWMCVSRGAGAISDVKYADTAIADIQGASFQIFSPSGSSAYPELNTTTITDVVEPFNSLEVNGNELKPPLTTGGATTVTGPFTLPVECSSIQWNLIFQSGILGPAQIKAEWWKIDSSGAEVAGTRQSRTDSINDFSYDQRYYTFEATPAAGFGRYKLQLTRLTPMMGGSMNEICKIEDIYSLRKYATKTFPGVTIIKLVTKATEGVVGPRERKFNLRFSRYIRTLTSDTLSTSRNFARIIAHVWTLAGNSISELDTSAMQAINTQFGENSELLRFDCSFDDADTSLGERMQTIASNARCAIWRDGTKWTVTRDQAKTYPELQLDYRNLAQDGESTITYSAHLPATYDGVEIEYVDEATQAKKAYFRVNITTGSAVAGPCSNPMKMKLIGCTTLNQASNRAFLEANRLLFSRVTVSDKSLSDGASLGLGSLVRWIDPNDFAGDDGLQAGEVLTINGSVITTSEELDWKGYTEGRMLFTGIDGYRLGSPVTCYPSSNGGVALSSVPSGIYTASPDRQLGSRYAFAVGLTSSELESSGLYTVTEINPEEGGKVSLALAQYDQRIYGAD